MLLLYFVDFINICNFIYQQIGGMTLKAYLIMANGFEEMEAMYPVSILRAVGCYVTTVSITGDRNVLGSHGINIIADTLLNDIEVKDADVIILPGGQPGTNNLAKSEQLKGILDYYYHNKTIASICAAPSILGRMGMLKNRKSVCYPGYESELDGAIIPDSKVAVDGNIITAIGPGATKEFALAIVKQLGTSEEYNKALDLYT